MNCWEQPTNISNWKEEHVSAASEQVYPATAAASALISSARCLCHFVNSDSVQIVFAVLGCWGVGIYSAMKIFGGGGKKSEPSAAPEQLDKH